MIIDGVRKGNQDARHAARREFGDGHGAGAADHEIGLGVASRHVIDEGDELALHVGGPIARAQVVQVFLTRLVNDQRSLTEQRERARHGLVQRLRTEAAADDEELQRSFAPPQTLLGLRDRRDVGTHWVAGPLGACQRVRKRDHDFVRNAGQHAVGEPGDRILLMQRQRPPEERCHHAARKSDIASEPEHDVGPDASNMACAFPKRK